VCENYINVNIPYILVYSVAKNNMLSILSLYRNQMINEVV